MVFKKTLNAIIDVCNTYSPNGITSELLNINNEYEYGKNPIYDLLIDMNYEFNDDNFIKRVIYNYMYICSTTSEMYI